MKFDRTERRILGALIEKRWTTPDQYPLTLNALVAACNQKSNRDPVVQLEEFEVEGCLLSLREKGYAMQHESHSGRVPRFAERMSDKMDFSRHEAAILAELMLRGPQTPGELYRRCKRMAPFASQGSLDEILHGLARRMHVEVMPKQSGQRYARYRHLLASDSDTAPAEEDEALEVVDLAAPAPAPATTPAPEVEARPAPQPSILSAPASRPAPSAMAVPPAQSGAQNGLRAEVEALREEVDDLRSRLEKLESMWE